MANIAENSPSYNDEKVREAELKAGISDGQSESGQEILLQKLLDKGHKYFDSGDYQMAKQGLQKPPLKLLKPVNLFGVNKET